jgi:hypothetical protein
MRSLQQVNFMGRWKKRAIAYLCINSIFLIPALLPAIGITFHIRTFTFIYFIYFFIFTFAFTFHFYACLIMLIIKIILYIKHRNKDDKQFFKKFIPLYIVNVFINILGFYFSGNFLMSIK